MRRVPFSKLPHRIFYDKETGAIVQISWLNDDVIVYSSKNEVVGNAHSYVVRNIVTDELEVFDNREKVSNRFELFDDRFGWFEFNDKFNTTFYIPNIINKLVGVQQIKNELVIQLENDLPIKLQFESEADASKEKTHFRRIISVIKKVKGMP